MSRWLTAIKSSWEHLEQDWWMMFREHDSMTEIDSQQLKTMANWKLECIQSIRCNSPLTIFHREESRLWMPILKFLYMAPPSCSWSWISDLFQKADWICGTKLCCTRHFAGASINCLWKAAINLQRAPCPGAPMPSPWQPADVGTSEPNTMSLEELQLGVFRSHRSFMKFPLLRAACGVWRWEVINKRAPVYTQ